MVGYSNWEYWHEDDKAYKDREPWRPASGLASGAPDGYYMRWFKDGEVGRVWYRESFASKWRTLFPEGDNGYPAVAYIQTYLFPDWLDDND